jgi:hypothetical protein
MGTYSFAEGCIAQPDDPMTKNKATAMNDLQMPDMDINPKLAVDVTEVDDRRMRAP